MSRKPTYISSGHSCHLIGVKVTYANELTLGQPLCITQCASSLKQLSDYLLTSHQDPTLRYHEYLKSPLVCLCPTLRNVVRSPYHPRTLGLPDTVYLSPFDVLGFTGQSGRTVIKNVTNAKPIQIGAV